ncbi:MAG: VOC family protein [Methanobacteriota archaeon]|nr:MAG: VOC family protein [Euryarchaeota archaeon]TLZ91761.1 MAG: VOC family protein [Euryarchaeota archaeon]
MARIMGFRYTGIRVRDLDRSIAFYTTVLGMRVTWRMKIRETGGEIAVLKSPRGTQRLELNWYPPRGRYREYRRGTNSTTWPSRFRRRRVSPRPPRRFSRRRKDVR